MWIKLRKKYINLQEAARTSGYSSDYIGYLIRMGKIEGKRAYSNTSWQISPKEIVKYCQKNKGLDTRDTLLLKKKTLLLKEAAQISGYTPDYIGYLIRKGKIPGKKVYSGPAWLTTEKAIKKYQEKSEIKKEKLKIESVRKQPIAKLVYDIFPPEKIQKVAREITGWKPYKTKFDKIFALGWRLALVVAILFLLIGIGPTEIFQKIVGALTEETKTVNFFSTLGQGDPEGISSGSPGASWQNPKNVEGEPNISADGDFNSFSEANSAVYQGGSLSLICQNFKTTAEKSENNIEQPKTEEQQTQQTEEQQEISEEEIPLETVSGGEIPGGEASESQPAEPETSNEIPIEPEKKIESPTSLLEKVRNFFGFQKTKAQQIPTFEELQNFPLQSAKIKFSFAIGEKKPDLEIPQSSPEESAPVTPGESAPLIPEESTPPSPEQPAPTEEKPLPIEQPQNIETPPEVVPPPESVPPPQSVPPSESTPPVENITPSASLFKKIQSLFGVLTTKAQEGNIPTEETISPIEEATPTTEGILAPTENINTPTQEVITPNLDTKIIIWYSLDNEVWFKLDTISSYPLSNFLNGGYFSYDAPFLKNWDDIKNLKIKLEGVIGGETNIIAYLDSVWIEANYAEQKEVKVEEPKKIFKIKIKDNSLLMGQFENSFSVNEEPTFLISEPELPAEEIIKNEKGEVIEEMEIPKTPEPEKSLLENVKEKILEPIIDLVTPEVGAQAKNIKTKIFGPDGAEIGTSPTINSISRNGKEESEIKISKQNEREFRPGLYKLEIEFETKDAIFVLEQDFAWGVLAINTNKSIFLPGETAYFQMAALKDDGHTICDANLKLEITSPSGQTTDSEVKKSGECGPDNVTQKPDYFAYYQTGGAGVYTMDLTNLDNGYKISDSFEVRDFVPFDIERLGPTRIYPSAGYEMKFNIKANEDFSGLVKELVPAGFEIVSSAADNVYTNGDEKIIEWQVDWKAGNSYHLSYQFNAPNISPYLYLLGKLEIGQFEEARFWQISADSQSSWNESCGSGYGISGCTCTSHKCGGTKGSCGYTCPSRSHASVAGNCAYTVGGTCGPNQYCDAVEECRMFMTCTYSSGQCAYTCSTGYVDCDLVTSNGCECNTGGAYTCVGTTCTPQITISGTTDLANCTGCVAVAVGSSIQAQTGNISSGAWSISNVAVSSGNIVTVFNNGAADANESTGITKYDGSGNITNMVLNQHVLSIGSDDNQTLTASTDLGKYDNDDDDNIMYSYNSSTLNVDDDNAYTDERLSIITSNGLTLANSSTLNTHDLAIAGTLTSGTSVTINVSGYWDNDSVFTASTETINFTSTDVAGENMDFQGSSDANSDINKAVFNGSGGAWSLTTALIVNDDITTTAGTISGTQNITVSGGDITGTNGSINLTGGTVTLSGTGNLGPTGSGTYTFYNLTLSGATTAAGDFTVSSVLTISNTYSFDASSKTITLSGSGTPFVINGSFTYSNSTVKYTDDSAASFNDIFYAYTDDGLIYGTNATYATARSTSSSFTNASPVFTVGQYYYFDGENWFYDVYRGYLLFDTSPIPDGATISSAKLYMAVTLDGSATDFDVRIHKYSWTNPINSGNQETNYDGALAATLDQIWRNTSGIALNTYYASPSLDTSWVDKTGYTKYSLVSSRDVGANSPTGSEYIGIYSADTTSTYKPYLEINSPTTLAATTYYNLEVGTTANSNAMTYSLGGNTTVQNTLTIGNTSSTANDTLTTTANNYSITSSSINITSGGTLTANGSIITITGSGTPFVISGTFTSSTSTITYTGSSATNVTSTTYYNLTINHAAVTFTAAGDITATKVLTITAGVFDASNRTITLSGSGTSFVKTGTFTYNTSTVNYTATAATNITAATYYNLGVGTTIDSTIVTYSLLGATVANNALTIGNADSTGNDILTTTGTNYALTAASMTITGKGTLTGNASVLDSNGDVSIASGGILTSTSGNFYIGGSWSNSGTFTHNSGTVIFDATATGKTINSGGTASGKKFYNIIFDSSSGGWTIQTNNLTAENNFNITNATSFTVASGITVTVQGQFKNDVGGSATTWTGSTLILAGSGSYTINTTKNVGGDQYATLQVNSGQYIRAWDSCASTYTINGTFYSMDHDEDCDGVLAEDDGKLFIWGAYSVPASTTDYWSYAKDFDGDTVSRQCKVTIQSGASVTVPSGASLEVKGGESSSSDKTVVTYTPASGSWNLNNNTGSELTFQEATIEYLKVNAGTVTVLNTTLNSEAVPTAGATLNVDWYLGVHVVNAGDYSNIDTDGGCDDITISESDSQSAVWRHNGSSWVGPADSKTTATGTTCGGPAAGKNPQPNSAGAMRIKEYARTSSGYTFYKYNLQIAWQSTYGEYNYKTDYGNKYISSTLNTECSDCDLVISENDTTSPTCTSQACKWQRDDIDNLATPTCSAGTGNSCLNEPPNNGSWYVGMLTGLSFSINSFTVNLGTLTPGADPTNAANTLTVTTSATNGYVITAWSTQEMTCSDAGACASEKIPDWTGTNASPTTWSPGSYGFGYSTNDDTLVAGEGDDNRFSSGSKFARFSHSGSGDPVADRSNTECPCSNQENTITYRIASSFTQRAGPYSTTIVYIVTAQY